MEKNIVSILDNSMSKKTIVKSRAEQSRAEQLNCCVKVLALMPGYEIANRIYDVNFLAPTIRTFQGGGLEPKVIVKWEKDM